jgi:hypothetical protein
MSVPEATMHEHGSAVSRQDDVRLARQVLPMQPKPKSHSMK